MQKIYFFAVLFLSVCLWQSCEYAHSNVTTLITDDCGKSWEVIQPGQSVPTRVGVCAYKITIPDYPMQGESQVKVVFKDNILASIEIDYDYSIIDPVRFIKAAKFLGRVNSDTAGSQFEVAENMVIDKRIKEVLRSMVIVEDVVMFSPSDFEDKITPRLNGQLDSLGIYINALSLVPVFGKQTSEAIDVATAMKIYESKNLQELGKQVITAKSGANSIVINK